jgi:hypothetical protein
LNSFAALTSKHAASRQERFVPGFFVEFDGPPARFTLVFRTLPIR